MSQPFPRLYAILDVDLVARQAITPLDLVDIWLNAGLRLIQLRAKTMASGAYLELADALAARCREADATFIVNDRADIAALVRASGVHIGQDDLPANDVRRLVGPSSLIGLSTHTAAQADAAVRDPIDYVAIGPVYPTASKAQPDPVVGLEGVRAVAGIARQRGLPVVAIGGITAGRAAAVIEAGAASVAVIGDLMGPDLAARAREWRQILG